MALLTDQDNPHDSDVPRVTLMTAHSAKGLEFNTVFVVGLEEDLFPSNMAETDRDVEEERRLFYVALTRAEKRCLLTYAKTRFRYGQLQFGTRSRFLGEIDPEYLAGQQAGRPTPRPAGRFPNTQTSYPRPAFQPASQPPRESYSPKQRTTGRWVSLGERSAQPKPSSPLNPPSEPSSPNAAPPSGLRAGMRVEHERFGQGEVVSVEGANENAKAVIRFDNVGTKTLLLKFARLRVL